MERDEDGTQPHQFDRRAMLRKLAVGGSMAMAGPMIARRASALMPPSQCVNGAVLNWSTLYPGNGTPNLTNPVNILVPGTGVTVTIGGQLVGTTAMARNFQVQTPPHGGINGKSLMFEQYPFPNTHSSGTGTIAPPNDEGGGQTITISFSTSVRNVRFTLTDIDNSEDDWSDRITFTGTGFGGQALTPPTSYTRGSAVRGVGATGSGTNLGGGGQGQVDDGNGGSNTNTGAFRNSVNDNNLDDNSNAGNLQLLYANEISTIRFRYWCGAEGSGTNSNQRINLSNITFDTCPEGVTPNLVQQESPVETELRVPAGSDDPVAPPPPGVD